MYSRYEIIKHYLKFLPAAVVAAILLFTLITGQTSGRISLINNYQPPVRSYATITDLTVTATPMYAPTVTNGVGASYIGGTSARLNGEITDDGNTNPVCIVYYGVADGTDNASAWGSNSTIGSRPLGAIFKDVAGLAPSTMYFYRWYAYNDEGFDWANTSENFTTAAYITPPSGLVLTDMGFTTVAANWTAGSGNYTMIRGLRNETPLSPLEGELLYYGPDITTNMTGLQLDTSEYMVVAWSFAADNVTYSAPIIASIGGEDMDAIADALGGLNTVLGDGIGVSISGLAELIIIVVVMLGLAALGYWRGDRYLFILSGLGFIIYGFTFWTTSTSFSILMVIAGIAIFIRAFHKTGVA